MNLWIQVESAYILLSVCFKEIVLILHNTALTASCMISTIWVNFRVLCCFSGRRKLAIEYNWSHVCIIELQVFSQEVTLYDVVCIRIFTYFVFLYMWVVLNPRTDIPTNIPNTAFFCMVWHIIISNTDPGFLFLPSFSFFVHSFSQILHPRKITNFTVFLSSFYRHR